VSTNEYYVYALLDPRQTPARPFYIGKGQGTRHTTHLLKTESSSKGQRIQEIRDDGNEPVSQILITGLSEAQAYLLEAQLIGAFGTVDSGGSLTNQIVPSGRRASSRVRVALPWGAEERASVGREILLQAVLDLLEVNPQGVTNSEIASVLGLRSEHLGGAKDYLSYSLLGILLSRKAIGKSGGKYRFAARDQSSA
jgi:hypothetical protein